MLNILLVEDNPGDARLTREALVAGLPEGFELVHAASLEAASRHLAQARVDVVLLDLQLPDAEGVAALVALRAVATTVPIIVLSGYSDDATALSAIVDGADDFVNKNDSNGSVLARAVRYAIGRQRAEDRLEHLRHHDPLVDVMNRPSLVSQLGRLVERGSSGEPFVLVSLDIEDFKAINAALGHHVGDLVLRAFGSRLRSLVRDNDLVARVGSDEFMVVVERATRAAGVAIARHIADSLARMPLPVGDHAIPVSAQIGLTCFPDDGVTVDALLRAADRALEIAHLSPGAGIVHADPHHAEDDARASSAPGRPTASLPLSIVWARDATHT